MFLNITLILFPDKTQAEIKSNVNGILIHLIEKTLSVIYPPNISYYTAHLKQWGELSALN